MIEVAIGIQFHLLIIIVSFQNPITSHFFLNEDIYSFPILFLTIKFFFTSQLSKLI